MEIIIAVAFMFVVVELKEYRQSKRIKKIALEVRSLKRISDKILEHLHANQKHLIEYKESVKNHESKVDDALMFVQESRDLNVKISTNLETIVKEYEINGIPFGYDRGKQFDLVEGL